MCFQLNSSTLESQKIHKILRNLHTNNLKWHSHVGDLHVCMLKTKFCYLCSESNNTCGNSRNTYVCISWNFYFGPNLLIKLPVKTKQSQNLNFFKRQLDVICLRRFSIFYRSWNNNNLTKGKK